MNFATLQDLTIPEGVVKQIADASGRVLWSAGPSPEASTLNGCSWKNISDLAGAGVAANYFAVGDCKAVTLSGTVGTLSVSGTYYVYIIGFNHNGAANTIDFGTFKTALSGGKDVALIDSKCGSGIGSGTKYFNMNHWRNETYTTFNYGGWKGCDLRYDVLGSTDVAPSGYGSAVTTSRIGYDASNNCAINPVAGTLMAALPSDLRAVMKPMTIYTDNVGNESTTDSAISASVDYLPLLAVVEVNGEAKHCNTYEANYQKQYSYFANGNSKIKYKHNSQSSYAYWFTRSPYESSDSCFCAYSSEDQFFAMGPVRNSTGLAPIFRV